MASAGAELNFFQECNTCILWNVFHMASAGAEFNFFQEVLYFWTVYTYSLFMCTHVYLLCFTASNECILSRVIPIFILKITLK